MATTPDDKNASLASLDDRARDHYHDALYLGRDARGTQYYWSRYHQAAVIFDDTTVTLDLPVANDGHRIADLHDLIETVAAHRGGWTELRVSGSLTEHVETDP